MTLVSSSVTASEIPTCSPPPDDAGASGPDPYRPVGIHQTDAACDGQRLFAPSTSCSADVCQRRVSRRLRLPGQPTQTSAPKLPVKMVVVLILRLS